MIGIVRLTSIAVVVLVGAFGADGSIAASQCQAPPGSAAVDQYCESIPQAGGNGSGQNGGAGGASGSSGSGGGAVSAATERKLNADGEDGKAVAVFAKQTGVRKSQLPTRKAATEGKAGASATANDVPSSNPLAAVSSSIQAGDTVGGGFIWVLLGITIGVAAAGWLAFRHRPASGGDRGPQDTPPAA